MTFNYLSNAPNEGRETHKTSQGFYISGLKSTTQAVTIIA